MLNLNDLNMLKMLRQQAKLSQKQLAKHANTTQSTIAKIEAGNLTPSINLATRILDALKLSLEDTIQAKDIMVLKILHFSPNTPLEVAIKQLTDNGFSQAPVIDGCKIIGKITEAAIMLKALDTDISRLKVSDVMDDVFPTVPPDAKSQEIAFLLKFRQALLVISKGKLLGIITKADIIQSLIRETKQM